MNVFIDANVLLDLFRMSSADLEELRKVAKLAGAGGFRLLLSSQLKDEFERNRELVIAQSLSQFGKSKLELHRPSIIRAHPESLELEKIQTRFRELQEIVYKRVQTETASRGTKADGVISELFCSAPIQTVPDHIINCAIRRSELGRPPGKPDSLGDAIHWEWLLEVVEDEENLHLVSRDGDFESPVQDGQLATYLDEEWTDRKRSRCRLYKSLDEFLKEHFPDVKLADQAHKFVAIDRLERSPNFATTHNAIRVLSEVDDYTPEEIKRLVDAYQSNSQINWILGDRDVREFAHKLVTMAYEADLIDEVLPIEEMLHELEIQEQP